MVLRAVLLDIDGTLLDSNNAHAKAWQEVLRRHGHHVGYDRLRSLIGKGGDKLLKEVADIDDQSEEGRLISEERRTLFTERYLDRLKPTRGARELLLRLSRRGLRLVVATSAGGDELPGLLKQAGIEDLVHAAASLSNAKASKPDPDIVQAALKQAGVQPDEAIMLGDTPYDIAAAHGAGVQCIVVRCGGWWTDKSFAGSLAIHDDPSALLRRIDTLPGGTGSLSQPFDWDEGPCIAS